MKLEYMKPAEIEQRSFEIITELLAGREFPAENEAVIKRCIHTSADFDYADNLYFSSGVLERLGSALREGACIVTDTQMVRSGINRWAAEKLGVEVFCFMSDTDVAEEATARSTTRAVVSMEKAMRLCRPTVFAIGNAPTALMRLCDGIREGYEPRGIIGVPVGFVNVVESKELVIGLNTPCIVARGRKGGSNIAAAICNAILYGLTGRV